MGRSASEPGCGRRVPTEPKEPAPLSDEDAGPRVHPQQWPPPSHTPGSSEQRFTLPPMWRAEPRSMRIRAEPPRRLWGTVPPTPPNSGPQGGPSALTLPPRVLHAVSAGPGPPRLRAPGLTMAAETRSQARPCSPALEVGSSAHHLGDTVGLRHTTPGRSLPYSGQTHLGLSRVTHAPSLQAWLHFVDAETEAQRQA